MVTLGQAASVASAGASVAVGVPVGAGVGAGTSTRWPTVRKHWVPRLLSSIIERTETSKKKAMLRQLSPSLTVYSPGGARGRRGPPLARMTVPHTRQRVAPSPRRVPQVGHRRGRSAAAGAFSAMGGGDRGSDEPPPYTSRGLWGSCPRA